MMYARGLSFFYFSSLLNPLRLNRMKFLRFLFLHFFLCSCYLLRRKYRRRLLVCLLSFFCVDRSACTEYTFCWYRTQRAKSYRHIFSFFSYFNMRWYCQEEEEKEEEDRLYGWIHMRQPDARQLATHVLIRLSSSSNVSFFFWFH